MFQAAARASDTMGARMLASPERAAGKAAMMFAPIVATRGATLVATAPIDSRSCVVTFEKSTSSRPRAVRKFPHAAFAMPTEPEMVEAASLAVVPAMPCACCTRAMASTTSA